MGHIRTMTPRRLSVQSYFRVAHHPAKRLQFARTLFWTAVDLDAVPAKSVNAPEAHSSFHRRLPYSVYACLRIGISGSACFQSVRKSWYVALARLESPDIFHARPSCS